MVALLLLLSPAALGVSARVVTNAKTVAYGSASTSAPSVQVPKGLNLTLTDYNEEWGKVSYKGRTAFVPLKYLNLLNPIKAWLSEDATLYGEPGADSMGLLDAGTEVYFLGVDGDYARVLNSHQNREGYIVKNALTTTQPEVAARPDRSTLIEQVIYTAQNLIGRPYSLIADMPNSFNCAALVYYCFNKVQGGSVGNTLYDQVHSEQHRKIKSVSALKRGDVVCFNIDDDSDPYGHVGIYLGDGYFIHASAQDGMVTVSRLTSDKYRGEFSWGRRVF